LSGKSLPHMWVARAGHTICLVSTPPLVEKLDLQQQSASGPLERSSQSMFGVDCVVNPPSRSPIRHPKDLDRSRAESTVDRRSSRDRSRSIPPEQRDFTANPWRDRIAQTGQTRHRRGPAAPRHPAERFQTVSRLPSPPAPADAGPTRSSATGCPPCRFLYEPLRCEHFGPPGTSPCHQAVADRHRCSERMTPRSPIPAKAREMAHPSRKRSDNR